MRYVQVYWYANHVGPMHHTKTHPHCFLAAVHYPPYNASFPCYRNHLEDYSTQCTRPYPPPSNHQQLEKPRFYSPCGRSCPSAPSTCRPRPWESRLSGDQDPDPRMAQSGQLNQTRYCNSMSCHISTPLDMSRLARCIAGGPSVGATA
jgi:hypothetical protein